MKRLVLFVPVAAFTLAGCSTSSPIATPAPTTATTAAPTSTTTTKVQTPDEQFLSALESAGVDIHAIGANRDGEPPEVWAPKTGRFECETMLKSKYVKRTPEEAAQMQAIGPMTLPQKVAFIRAAAKVYCPESL